MSEQNTLAVTGLDPKYSVSVTPEAIAQREKLLETAALITHVNNPQDQKIAVEIVSNLKAWGKAVEKARVFFTDPLLVAQRLLKSTADKARENTDPEAKRIESLLADYHRDQEEIARKAREAAAKAEQDRLAEIARVAKVESDRLAEVERQRQEALRLATEAKSKKARDEAAAEAKRLQEQQEADELAKEFEEPAPAPAYVPPPVVIKPKGGAVREVVLFEVIDIEALYEALPELVELSARTQAINFYLSTPGRDINSVPGIKAWKETKVSVRSSAIQQDALEA